MKSMLLVVALFLNTATANPQSSGAMSDADVKALVKDSLRFMEHNNNKALDYSYTVRTVRKQFDSEGKLRSEESTVGKRLFQDGIGVYRILERNGKPVTPQERKEQDETIAKRVSELRSMPPSERDTSSARWRRMDEWGKEIPEALSFRIVGQEIVDGHSCWIVSAEPRPGYRPVNMQARVFEKLKGRLWIDKADRELVKAEGETFDAVNIGLGILAKVEKGTRFTIHRVKLPDGDWVAESQTLHYGARVMLVRWMSNEMVTHMSDYRHKSHLSASR